MNDKLPQELLGDLCLTSITNTQRFKVDTDIFSEGYPNTIFHFYAPPVHWEKNTMTTMVCLAEFLVGHECLYIVICNKEELQSEFQQWLYFGINADFDFLFKNVAHNLMISVCICV